MRTLNDTDRNFHQQLADLRAQLLVKTLLLDSPDVFNSVQAIIQRIRSEGDAALCELTVEFDSVELKKAGIKVNASSLALADEAFTGDLRAAVDLAIANVQRYQRHIARYQDLALSRPGIELATRYRPLDRVGIYVPGGSAPLVSTLIMTAVPAQVAGVRQLAVCSPPRYHGDIHPAILAVCGMLGINEVYRIGGAQAVAAMALGTETVRPVSKIVGPGSVYVQLAKKAMFGIVDIDSFAGPSEIVVLADGSADPRFVAADLIAQAEHAPGSAILLTPTAKLPGQVARQIDRLLDRSDRAGPTRECLDRYSAIIVTETLDRAIDMVNRLAPEHLSVQTEDPDQIAQRCINAGAIFIGEFTSEAVGDYIAGPSHVLPTGGTANFFSPLNVMDFMRHTSMIKYDRTALQQVYPALKVLTNLEQLPGHLLSASVRLEK